MKKEYYHNATKLLQSLIETPSISANEDGTAAIIEAWLQDEGVEVERIHNNIIAKNYHFNVNKPTILLNSHHDTVKPNDGYTRNPFESDIASGRLYGLGSNDAGGALVSLISVFLHYFKAENLKYNLILAATAEEETSGKHGISSTLSALPPIDFAIVGEPTSMHMAIAEKGLMVVDCISKGQSGHAAHHCKKNAIYSALADIEWVKHYQFSQNSKLLGKVKMTVTQINAGQQHNVVPETCQFVVDVRVNEHYTNQEVFEIMNRHMNSDLHARSFRLNSSAIGSHHPIVDAGLKQGISTYGSPTLSDQALLPCPSIKWGPGDSSRSHMADEYIELGQIEEGILQYIKILDEILK
ncbi:MAG: M20 family metallo-hydrolase [Fulvivirga sp.]|nr:M20 family metallo-hydrolase [Fulvivirga sp.]